MYGTLQRGPNSSNNSHRFILSSARLGFEGTSQMAWETENYIKTDECILASTTPRPGHQDSSSEYEVSDFFHFQWSKLVTR